ncbi:MAG: hypothetical protein ACFE9L_00770 [Candidatus Hodarchaeota archaeon]
MSKISSLEQFLPIGQEKSVTHKSTVLYTVGYGNRSLKTLANRLINRGWRMSSIFDSMYSRITPSLMVTHEN